MPDLAILAPTIAKWPAMHDWMSDAMAKKWHNEKSDFMIGCVESRAQSAKRVRTLPPRMHERLTGRANERTRTWEVGTALQRPGVCFVLCPFIAPNIEAQLLRSPFLGAQSLDRV